MLKKLTYSLPGQIFIAALFAAIVANLLPTAWLTPNSTLMDIISLGKIIYIGLLKMLVGVIVLFALLQGITNIGSIVKLKSLGSKTICIYALTSTLAIFLGLGTALLMPKWPELISLPNVHNIELISSDAASGSAMSIKLLNMALVNPFNALANNNLLAIVVFAIALGVALLISLPEKHPVFLVISGINTALNKLISSIIKLAPIAVFSIIFQYTSQGNTQLFSELAQFALLVLTLTAIHGFITLPLLAKIITGRKIIPMLKSMTAPMSMAFATSSSAATLPLSMQTAQKELGISQSTTSMVLPLGSIMNMDGTALFEGVAAIFLAQLYGIDLGTIELIMIFLMAMVSSIGAPGVPSGSMSGMQLVLLAVGIPLEAIAILLIIERPLDTFRTSINVEGDLIAAMIVDKWQKN